MRGKISRTPGRVATFMIMLATLSCSQEDIIKPEIVVTKTDYYILPGSSAIIDMESFFKQAFANSSFNISASPLHGEVSHLDTYLFKFKPAANFTSGSDEIVFSVVSDGKTTHQETVTIFVKQKSDAFPCALYAVQDRAIAKSGTSVSIRLLENDRLCLLDNSSLQISIHSTPQFGEGRLEGDSILVYTPGSAFTGSDELVYKLTASSGKLISYGIITISDVTIRFQKVPKDLTEIFFLDESTGFLGGYGGLYKTTDGGTHWNQLFYPYPNPVDTRITEIFFLDANIGFASYITCMDFDYYCEGGLMRTKDGGASWEVIYNKSNVSSVFFTSLTTGFINAYNDIEPSKSGVLKTEDGGTTWRQVFNSDYLPGSIQFANSTTGYSILWDQTYLKARIFVTTDAGESWKLSIASEAIDAFAVTPQNILCAVFSTRNTFATEPSSIVRSVDGVAWNYVANFPFTNSAIEFSPSGDVGFTAGITNLKYPMDTDSLVLSISRTTDKGITWKEEDVGRFLYGNPMAIAAPSNNVAYILCPEKIIKYIK